MKKLTDETTGNSVTISKYDSIEVARQVLIDMITYDCVHCIDCRYCVNCSHCINCLCCGECYNCINCLCMAAKENIYN